MSSIAPDGGNMVVKFHIEDILKQDAPYRFTALDISDPFRGPYAVEQTEKMVSFTTLLRGAATRLVRSKVKRLEEKFPSAANVNMQDGKIVVVLGDWRKDGF